MQEIFSSSEFFSYEIIVAFRRIAGDHFSDEACAEELDSENHEDKRQIEIYRLREIEMVSLRVHRHQFHDQNGHNSKKTDYEHQRSEQTEDVHRLDSEP